MDITELNRPDNMLEGMDIIEEFNIPIDMDPKDFIQDPVIQARMVSALNKISLETDKLKAAKQKVLNWFASEEDKLARQEEKIKESLLEFMQYLAHTSNETKIKTWEGTIYTQTRQSVDWQGLTGKSQEILTYAKRKNLLIKVEESVSLTDVKKEILNDFNRFEEISLPVNIETVTNISIRKS